MVCENSYAIFGDDTSPLTGWTEAMSVMLTEPREKSLSQKVFFDAGIDGVERFVFNNAVAEPIVVRFQYDHCFSYHDEDTQKGASD